MKQKDFEAWVHAHVDAPFVFGVCQQGVGGLSRLRASLQLRNVTLPSQAAVEALAAKWTESRKAAAENEMEDI
jgi:hypothetical protein